MTYEQVGDRVVNDLGQIAMVHHDSNSCVIEVEGTGVVCSFESRDSISFCWVDPQYVPWLLSVRAGMCCGKIRDKFKLANMNQTCQWQDRKRC